MTARRHSLCQLQQSFIHPPPNEYGCGQSAHPGVNIMILWPSMFGHKLLLLALWHSKPRIIPPESPTVVHWPDNNVTGHPTIESIKSNTVAQSKNNSGFNTTTAAAEERTTTHLNPLLDHNNRTTRDSRERQPWDIQRGNHPQSILWGQQCSTFYCSPISEFP